MHEAEEHVHPFEYALDLQDLDGILKMWEMYLQKIFAFEAPIEVDNRRSVWDRTRSIRPVRCSIDDGVQEMP